jgi:acetyl-CoA C-acetyltransferase
MTTETQRQFYRQFPERKRELQREWAEDADVGPPAEVSGLAEDGIKSHPEFFHSLEERKHGLDAPVMIYPLIENALRRRYGASFEAHQQKIATMMSEFSKVAASQPEFAWIPEVRTPDEIARPNPSNRWVGFPYTKYMNANDNIDGAAAWLMCSTGTAKRLGIDRSKWVYQHSGAHCHEGTEQWHVTARPGISELPGMTSAITHCFEAAGASPAQLKYLDLYSCFPCVVQLAADALGISHDDPRGFTVTGGLPFYGQFACSAGALVATVELLRKDREAFGLVTGNGGYAQKHSAGLYSCARPTKVFELPDLEELQGSVNDLPVMPVNGAP